MHANHQAVAKGIAGIDEEAWTDIAYAPGCQAQAAETGYRGRRLVVRGTRLIEPRLARLWPDWCHLAFLTDLDGEATELDSYSVTLGLP